MSRYFEYKGDIDQRDPGEATLLSAAATLTNAMVDACGNRDYQDTWNILNDSRDRVMSKWIRLYGCRLLDRVLNGEVASS